PVMIFVPGKLAYNYSTVDISISNNEKENNFYFEKDKQRYINVGAQAVKNHRLLLEKVERISQQESNCKSHFNSLAKHGIIVRGLAYSMTYELIEKYEIQDRVHLLNLDLVFPLNQHDIKVFITGKEVLTIIEDQDGFVENQLKMNFFNDLKCTIHGKDIFPKYGEISINQIDKYLVKTFELKSVEEAPLLVPSIPERLGTFCEGCPHTGSYYSVDSVIKELDGVIGGDIGCSSLAPFRADWLMCMNAGIGVSQGMSQVLKDQPVISTGGDGSFFHAGALSLLSAIQNNINLIHMVFDNSTIAMTGHQNSPSEFGFDHQKFLEGMGVDKVVDVSPYDPKDFIQKFKEELPKKGVRVFWVKGACVLKGNDFIESRRNTIYPTIDASKCGSCSKCYEDLACPAIINLKDAPDQKLQIDLDRCVRCGVCNEICPNGAISIQDMV
ncbi:MAG: thiamine pyrophosphate-dependent enzyme, partial [Salibacteraceae bacterium]